MALKVFVDTARVMNESVCVCVCVCVLVLWWAEALFTAQSRYLIDIQSQWERQTESKKTDIVRDRDSDERAARDLHTDS